MSTTPPNKIRRRLGSPYRLYEFGKQGRHVADNTSLRRLRTGIKLHDNGERDEHGMQPMDGLFSSPETNDELLDDDTKPDEQDMGVPGSESGIPNQDSRSLSSSDLTRDVFSIGDTSMLVSTPGPLPKNRNTIQQTTEERRMLSSANTKSKRPTDRRSIRLQHQGKGPDSNQNGSLGDNKSSKVGRHPTSQACSQ
ncbi:cupin domain-containing protein [Colletotrichum abscissum]|uniref:cupin domain-containing protein n=1 Tax=Colletotrichum abscissum TaxID=1671311 RepID=UPI0027D5C252|nr:cupin domain-containing protein [Colletotrichum abscissum]KAK1506602.1 cupin domain-containing protein [Colletotrichum abscissum]